MMMPGKKSLASVIIGGMEPPKDEGGDEDLQKMSAHSAAKKLLSAIESKSPDGIVQAFQELYDIHEAKEDEDEGMQGSGHPLSEGSEEESEA